MFYAQKHRRAITELLRRFAIREDRAELGNNTGARFKSKLIDPRKGLRLVILQSTSVKTSMGVGWVTPSARRRVNHYVIVPSTSLRGHRCTVFNNFVFGIPGRQAYRELRLFASQATRAMKTSKPGAPVLMDPKLDAVLAAADVGCFATYIMKQGGVLVPRKITSFIPPTSRQSNQNLWRSRDSYLWHLVANHR